MCGIAGAFCVGREAMPLAAADLKSLQDSMARRGPDDEGLWLDRSQVAGLAHRRLSIIDLSSAAHQPMEDPETGNRIVFNGEIYNYRALANELSAAGCAIRSNSDTEVILHLYRTEGIACLRRLAGMFAIAIWDAQKRAIFLARDPYGIKPLYFAEDSGRVFFASQVRALRTLKAFKTRRPLLAAEAAFFLFGYVPEPITFFEGISAVPAGSWLRVDEQGIAAAQSFASIRNALSNQPPSAPSPQSVDQQVAAALEDSVRRHLVADVPVGLFLSAGRDSAAIAALATRLSHERLRTFTLGFEDFTGTARDEVPVAEATAAALGTDHRTIRISRTDFEQECDHILDAMDQPTIDGLNTYLVSKIAAESGLKVALSGLGGDELFGGYAHFKTLPRLQALLQPLARWKGLGRGLRSFSAPILSTFTSPKYAGILEYGTSLEGGYLLSRSLFAPWELSTILGSDRAQAGLEALVTQVGLPATADTSSTAHAKLVELESTRYLRNQLLRDTDWASMAHSLEVRVPFVDFTLLQALAPLIGSSTPPTKGNMMTPLRSMLPLATINRAKSGFEVPISKWLASGRSRNVSGEPLPHWRSRGLRPWAFQVYNHFTQKV